MHSVSTGTVSMEHRCGTRMLLLVRAIVCTTGRETACQVIDASVTGAFVETLLRPPLLSRVTLRVPLMHRDDVELDGCVVRVGNRGFAIEWLEPGSDETIRLLSLADSRSVPETGKGTRVPGGAGLNQPSPPPA